MTSTCRVLLFLGLSVAGPAFRLRAQEAPAPNTRPVRSLASAITTSEADIEAVKARLLETRQRISDERVSKQTALAKLEEDIVRLRRECGAQASAERSAEDALRARADEALQLVQVLKSAWNGLVEVRRTTETHFTLVDRVVLARQLEQAEALLDRQGDPSLALETYGRSVLTLLTAHVEACPQVRRFEGLAIDASGRERRGTFVRVGGAGAWFAADGGAGAIGLVRLEHGSVQPHVRDMGGEADTQAIRQLAEGREAAVPLDVTGGDAVRTLQARRTLSEAFNAGGVVMYPLLAVALICVGLGLWKAAELWRIAMPSEPQVQAFAHKLFSEREAAASQVSQTQGPLKRLLNEALAYADAPRERLEEILHDTVLAEIPALESKLGVLSVGVAVAPLLGLLGTVTGMIHTFRLISVFGTGDARMLSGGISEALITTEAGLSIAIPLLLLHAVLARRAKALADGLEKSALAVLEACPLPSATEGVPSP